ncbi:MAG: helix-turn-helix transcriptional regulator [Armatimonadetes bacterium]|nr:helix-turn-helix transcriptional regulator [Armatimonadota bacterium]
MGPTNLEERQILRRSTASTVDVVLADMDPGYVHHRSTCPDGQFWLPISGLQVVAGWRGHRRQGPFELLYYCPREPAVRTTDERTLAYGVRLRLSELRDDERDRPWVEGWPSGWSAKREVIRLVTLAMRESADPHDLDEVVAQWISSPTNARPEAAEARWMAKVEDLLREDSSRSLIDLARRLELAPAYLSAQYSRVCGRTISRRRRQIMLDEALRLAGERSLNEAAVEVGFYDASHFHRVCVAEMGIRPSELRTFFAPVCSDR